MSLVLGGGIGGLASAYYLAQAGKKATVVEAGKRLGGWIRTIQDPSTGVRFDKGPRTLRVKGEPAANTLRLIEELGLEKKILPITQDQPSAKNRMIYVNSRLHLLPTSFLSIFRKTPPFSKPIFASVFKDLFAPVRKSQDDSIYDFVERRFGKEMADYLISAMICGICAGDAKDISVKFLMPQLFEWEQKQGSVMIGMVRNILDKNKPKNPPPDGALNAKAAKENWNIFGFDGGMETFPNALAEKIVSQGVEVKLGQQVTKISLNKHSVKCHFGNEVVERDSVISSLPANRLAPLLKDEHPILAEELAGIPFVDVAVVNLAYKGKRLEKDAFGFLIPPSQKVPILGVIFDSCNFDAGDWTVLTVMMGGAWFNKYFSKDVKSEEFLELAVQQTRDILKIDGPPAAHDVAIMKGCIPQYVVGHYDRVGRINSYITDNRLPLSLVGSSYNGVGVNDVILSARRAVESLSGVTGIRSKSSPLSVLDEHAQEGNCLLLCASKTPGKEH